jgi:hypothetical protein
MVRRLLSIRQKMSDDPTEGATPRTAVFGCSGSGGSFTGSGGRGQPSSDPVPAQIDAAIDRQFEELRAVSERHGAWDKALDTAEADLNALEDAMRAFPPPDIARCSIPTFPRRDWISSREVSPELNGMDGKKCLLG